MLSKAIAYFLEPDEGAPDAGPGGLLDDRAVVTAAEQVLTARRTIG